MKAKAPVYVKLRGVRYEVRFVHSIRKKKSDSRFDARVGECDSPTSHRPVIRICENKGITEKVLVDTVLHELLHGCIWELSEDTVVATAASMTKALYKMGFRIVRKPKPKAHA